MELQTAQLTGLIDGSMEAGYMELVQQATRLSEAEFSFYPQCVKNRNFKVVDRNTRFFHALTKRNNKRKE